ncbi:hypothetical protein Patl1_09882 [Pistacia atlantica]|uniref:Uncharacterized protein n=1 Tax=Pistacia atlantica TaxID=434234 RepID=A0ACC1A710_9ROSI|nr:hypothetical protein Patl1_09882 [Pistacia atlantica]
MPPFCTLPSEDAILFFSNFRSETALHLLNLDESLAELKDKKGYTGLHLLATIPSAFKSGYGWATWINKVLYLCRLSDR